MEWGGVEGGWKGRDGGGRERGGGGREARGGYAGIFVLFGPFGPISSKREFRRDQRHSRCVVSVSFSNCRNTNCTS